MREINRNPSPAQLRRFGLSMLGAFGVLGMVLYATGRTPAAGWAWAGTGRQVAAIVCWFAGMALCTSVLVPGSLGRRVYVAWMAGSHALGVVTTTILLSVLYVVLLPPFALIRLRDPLRRRSRCATTFWETPTPHEPTLERMMRPF